jgi:hypothetical protein
MPKKQKKTKKPAAKRLAFGSLEWLREKAEIEDQSLVSVGGLVHTLKEMELHDKCKKLQTGEQANTNSEVGGR